MSDRISMAHQIVRASMRCRRAVALGYLAFVFIVSIAISILAPYLPLQSQTHQSPVHFDADRCLAWRTWSTFGCRTYEISTLPLDMFWTESGCILRSRHGWPPPELRHVDDDPIYQVTGDDRSLPARAAAASRKFSTEEYYWSSVVATGWPFHSFVHARKRIGVGSNVIAVRWMGFDEPATMLPSRQEYGIGTSLLLGGVIGNWAIWLLPSLVLAVGIRAIRYSIWFQKDRCIMCNHQLCPEQAACPECGADRICSCP